MAVVLVKSAAITAMDTAGSLLPKTAVARGALIVAKGKVEHGAADSIASIYRYCRVPSNAVIDQIYLRCTAIATAPAMDIGLYKTTADGGAVVSVALFASAQVLTSALAILTDVTNESTTVTPTLYEQPLWQVLGLASDPGIMYDVCGTLTVATTATGQSTLRVGYTE
jgi:hypothetical protein